MSGNSIPPYRVFTIYAVAFILGIFVSSFFSLDIDKVLFPFLFLISMFCFSALMNFVLKNRTLTMVSWSFVFILLATIIYSYFDKSFVNLPKTGNLEIKGSIVSNPQTDYKKQQIIVKVIQFDGKTIKANMRILVDAPKFPVLAYGDIVELDGNVQRPDDNYEISYQKYLKKNLISGVIIQTDQITNTGEARSTTVMLVKGLYLISSYFEQSINRILPEPQASLASGLILGIKRNIPADLSDDLSKAGLTHIIALSGFNVTIIMKVLSDLLRKPLGKKKTFILGMVFVLFFVIMTGAASSVIRAAIFSTLIIYGSTIGRKADQTNLILLAAIIMVMINPFVLVNDVGFQLSFLAFAGLIYISPLLTKLVSNSKVNNLPEWIKSPLIETSSAQLAVFPLIIYVFGRLSVIAPIANLIVLWILPLSMLVSFLAGIGGLIYLYIGKIAGLFAWPVLSYIISATKITANLPFSSFELGKNSIIPILVLYLIIGTFLIVGYKKYKIAI
jgi:competence protein ComEC